MIDSRNNLNFFVKSTYTSFCSTNVLYFNDLTPFKKFFVKLRYSITLVNKLISQNFFKKKKKKKEKKNCKHSHTTLCQCVFWLPEKIREIKVFSSKFCSENCELVSSRFTSIGFFCNHRKLSSCRVISSKVKRLLIKTKPKLKIPVTSKLSSDRF